MLLNWSSMAVSIVFTSIAVLAMMIVATKKLIIPTLIAVFDDKYEDAQAAISRGMSALGTKSGQSRNLKKMEDAIFNDLMKQYPEIEILLDIFSPDTADLIRENPEGALRLIARYKPLIDEWRGSRETEKKGVYDL